MGRTNLFRTWIFYHCSFNKFMNIKEEIKAFIENEARSCSMDFGCITAEYVYRMLGGKYPMNEIRDALNVCLKEYYG